MPKFIKEQLLDEIKQTFNDEAFNCNKITFAGNNSNEMMKLLILHAQINYDYDTISNQNNILDIYLNKN